MGVRQKETIITHTELIPCLQETHRNVVGGRVACVRAPRFKVNRRSGFAFAMWKLFHIFGVFLVNDLAIQLKRDSSCSDYFLERERGGQRPRTSNSNGHDWHANCNRKGPSIGAGFNQTRLYSFI